MTKCKFYMRNGTVIEIICEKITARVNQITNALVGYSIEGGKDIKPLYIAVSEVVAVTSTEIELEDTAIETEILKNWISVNDRLPEKEDKQYSSEVLITDGKAVFLAYYDYYYKMWWNGVSEIEDISHWMPLPEMPEMEANNDAKF